MLFGSTVLEVLIGMVFVYLLLSLLCSAINEYIEAVFNYRGKNLRRGIELLLNDQHEDLEKDSVDLASKLYDHGLIRGLYSGKRRRKLPSYIPAHTFALALWNMASKGGTQGATTDLAEIRGVIENNVPNKELREALTTLIDDAKGNFDQAVKNIEDWYNAGMDRVSGWYKRRVQMILIVIGIIMAVAINADSINIGKALFQNDALRKSIVAEAEKVEPLPAATPTPDTNSVAAMQEREKKAAEQVDVLRTKLDSLGLPLGWVGTQRDQAGNITNANDPRRRPEVGEVSLWLLKIVGLFLTGLAISQGAPFWFDILNKFMVIRSTVKPREKSIEEASKDAQDDDSTKNKKKEQGK